MPQVHGRKAVTFQGEGTRLFVRHMTVSGSQLPSPGPVTEDALSDCGVGSSGVRVGTGWTLVGAVSGGKGVSMQPLPVCCWGEMPGWGQQSPGSPTCLPAPTLLCPPCAVGRDAFCRCRQEELRALSSGQLGLHWSLSLCPYLCQGACSLHPQAPGNGQFSSVPQGPPRS